MDTAGERRAFRKRLSDLTDQELAQWSFLVGLCARIECELLAYHALFAPDIELSPAPDTQVAGIQLLITSEMKRRSAAKAKLHKLYIEGENYADHAQNGNATH
jgi:hypothetical protein